MESVEVEMADVGATSENSIKDSTGESSSRRFKRGYKACLNCRIRKVKCDLGPVDKPREGKCARCLRERKDCVFVESKRGGKQNVLSSLKRKYTETGESGLSDISSDPNNEIVSVRGNSDIGEDNDNVLGRDKDENGYEVPRNISNAEGTLLFLAETAGKIARVDERDTIDAKQRHEQIEATFRKSPSFSNIAPERHSSVQTRSKSSQKISTNSSATSISSASSELANGAGSCIRAVNTMSTIESSLRPERTTSLSNIEYIGGPNSILEVKEAERLIHLFFTFMHPFFPYIPKFLRSSSVLPGYPILLCAILTIASRYFPLENNYTSSGNLRHIEVHDKLWIYVQKLISQTVWAEASTRSIGTVYAFLLFTEWNPRAIHWRWTDYANKEEDLQASEPSSRSGPNKQSEDENFAGLGAMRRSHRMSWMLSGSAVRLAQDMSFMDVSPKTFIATHTAEINSVMNNGKRSMLLPSFSDIEVDADTEDVSEAEQDLYEEKVLKLSDDELSSIAQEGKISFTFKQKAKIELLQLVCLSVDSLYGRKAKLSNLTQSQNLSLLNILNSLLNNWGNKYKSLLVEIKPKYLRNMFYYEMTKPDSKVAQEITDIVETETFIFEYNYAKLYIFSLALNPASTGKSNILSRDGAQINLGIKLDEISKSAKYIERAFNAANEMLSSAHRLFKLKFLRYMPVRWVSRIVGAAAFIVKCYSTIKAHTESQSLFNASGGTEGFDSTILTLSLISIDKIVKSIHRAAIALRDCSPDELHLCTRYSNVLMYLCSEMKNKAKSFNSDASRPTMSENNNIRSYKNRRKSDENIRQNTSQHEQRPSKSSQLDYNENGSFGIEHEQSFHNYLSDSNNQRISSSNVNNERVFGHIEKEDISIENNGVSKVPLDNEVMAWFVNDKNIGLDFVAPWTELIEQQLEFNDPNLTLPSIYKNIHFNL